MAFEGIPATSGKASALARGGRFALGAHRGIEHRGIPTAQVRAVGFDPASNELVIALENGDQLRERVRYNGQPTPGMYTMRRLVAGVHDGSAFAPDRPMGGTPNRDGYVIAFSSPTRATLNGVEAFTVLIGREPRWVVKQDRLALWPGWPRAAATPDAGTPAPAAPSAPGAAATPDAGAASDLAPAGAGSDVGDRALGNRLVDDRGTANRGTSDMVPLADGVIFKITWHGDFGGDLSATVRVDSVTKDRKGNFVYSPLAETEVGDPDKQGGLAAERLPPAVLVVPRHDHYRILINPLNQPPNDRYKATWIRRKVDKRQAVVSVDQELVYHRENRNNVDDTWDWREIDSAKASLLVRVTLFKRPVTVHAYVVPRVNVTNALFAAQPATIRGEIADSIFRLGHQNLRTTTTGRFSNHSVGVAFDINANSDTKQDDHFFDRHMPLLDEVVQPIVQLDPRFARFNIRRDKGLTQLAASHAFNDRFPIHVAALLGRNQDVVDLERHTKQIAQMKGLPSAAYYVALRDQIVRSVAVAESKKRLRAIAESEKNAVLKRRYDLIQANWDALFTWVLGADVWDSFPTKRKKRAVGMIPLHPILLQIMLKAGWSWGGDWERTKDYMHFEDADAQGRLKRG
jgi:hypothetical protein